jgi:hypothetical protein
MSEQDELDRRRRAIRIVAAIAFAAVQRQGWRSAMSGEALFMLSSAPRGEQVLAR